MGQKACPVIIVEDDDDIRDSVVDALETEGYGVISFRNGREAFDAAGQWNGPGLILLDLMMPVMDGWQFLEARKNLPPPCAQVPIYILSAVADQQRIKSAGADGYIRKPLDLDTLLQLVGKFCDQVSG